MTLLLIEGIWTPLLNDTKLNDTLHCVQYNKLLNLQDTFMFMVDTICIGLIAISCDKIDHVHNQLA